MDDSRSNSNSFSSLLGNDAEWGGVDYMNLEAPNKWRYDEESGKLHMLFQDGKTSRLVCSSAQLEKKLDFFQIAILASSQQILLWYTNETPKLNASTRN